MESGASFLASLGVSAEELPRLPPAEGRAILAALVAEACKPTSMWRIERGRAAVRLLPRAWVLEHIESAADEALLKELPWAGWEYRRLLELCGPYGLADVPLVRRLARRGLESSDPDMREAAEDFLAWQPEPTAPP